MIDPATISTDRSASDPPPRARRRDLTLLERLVCVPLGFLWLVFLALLGVPVMIIMTILYFVSRAFPPGARRRARRDAQDEAEEDIA